MVPVTVRVEGEVLERFWGCESNVVFGEVIKDLFYHEGWWVRRVL